MNCDEINPVNDEIVLKKKIKIDNICKQYEVFYEPKFFIKRQIFDINEKDFLEFELRKVELLRQVLNEDRLLQKKIKNCKMKNIFNNMMNNSLQDTIRYLNLFHYDVDRAFNYFNKLLDIIKKFKISEDVFTNPQDEMENSNFFYYIGKDKADRPIIGIDLMQIILEKTTPYSLIKSVFSKTNKIIKNEMIPGKSEQIVILLEMGEISQNELMTNHSDIIKLIQIIFPSRLHMMYVSLTNPAFYYIINDSLLEYNSERVKMFDIKNKSLIKKISDEINPEIFNNFFINKIRNSVNTLSDNSFIVYLENNLSNENNQNQNLNNPFKKEFRHDRTSQRNLEENLSNTNKTMSKQNMINVSNSTWMNSNFKIDNCNFLSIDKIKNINNNLSICRHNSFSIGKKDLKRIFLIDNKESEIDENKENIQKSRSRLKRDIIIEKTRINHACCQIEDTCIIF